MEYPLYCSYKSSLFLFEKYSLDMQFAVKRKEVHVMLKLVVWEYCEKFNKEDDGGDD
jgi:hypothetical protein